MNLAKLNKKNYYEGRKLRKSFEAEAKRRAKALLAGDQNSTELADARAIMNGHHWMKAKHIDCLVIDKPLLGKWVSAITFVDLPRGVPNILGAPERHTTREAAEGEAMRLLVAAYVKCEETKKMMRERTFSDCRIFVFGDLKLEVPGEMVDAAARKFPDLPPEDETQRLRKGFIDQLHPFVTSGTMTGEKWDGLSEDQQINIMVQASHLLCLNINSL